jgi:hypothetical protein
MKSIKNITFFLMGIDKNTQVTPSVFFTVCKPEFKLLKIIVSNGSNMIIPAGDHHQPILSEVIRCRFHKRYLFMPNRHAFGWAQNKKAVGADR